MRPPPPSSLVETIGRDLAACRNELVRHAPIIDWTEATLSCTCGWSWQPVFLRDITEEWTRHLQAAATPR